MPVTTEQMRAWVDAGLSQSEVARLMGVSRSTVCRWTKAHHGKLRNGRADNGQPDVLRSDKCAAASRAATAAAWRDIATRASDERLLRWLDMRRHGANWADIARAAGRGRGQVQNACKAVLAADLAESGEPAETVRAAYDVVMHGGGTTK